MNEEQKQQLAAERESRANDLLLMRELDKQSDRKLMPLRADAPKELVIAELNLRIRQYAGMFPFSLEFLTLQTIQDFKRNIIPLQAKKLDTSKPVAMLRDKAQTQIFVNQNVVKNDFKAGGVQYFIVKESE